VFAAFADFVFGDFCSAVAADPREERLIAELIKRRVGL
jgi:hypothetical protein